MKKIKILITTFNRPGLLLDLLGDIREESAGFDISLYIVNDCSSENYLRVKQYLEDHFDGRYEYVKNRVNNGKKNYWKTINNAFLRAAGWEFDYLIQLPDDVRLVDEFFDKAVQAYEAVEDPRVACVNILVDFARLMKPFWTSYMPHMVAFGCHQMVRTGWMDLCYICSHRFFEALCYCVDPVDPRWSGNKELSSGVGRQLSRRLISQDYSIYSVNRSLVIHDHHPSVMHPSHRQENKLITNHDMDKITATMATFPGREESLQEAILSLIDQVDELHVYANDYSKPPLKLKHPKLTWHLGNKLLGDLGDAGKFYQADQIRGYHLTADDDICYPADYVATMIGAIERYERRCVISAHGRTFGNGRIASYYRSAIGRYACLRSVASDVFAHVIGTGVLAYHTDTIRVNLSDFKRTNMADIWFSKVCQEHHVPRLVIKHQGGWIRESAKLDQATTIYAANVHDDSFQTEVANSVVWTAP